MSDVFISYSRKDSLFTQQLNTAFVGENRVVWVDWQGIPAGEDWWNEIKLGIENAETFVCVISEHWLTSSICHQELAYARELNKRILPFIHQRIDPAIEKRVKGSWMDSDFEDIARENWDSLRNLNWIFANSETTFEEGFQKLLTAIDEDQPHLKAHTRYLQRSLEWKRSKHNPSFLLMGDDLRFSENWLHEADNEAKLPSPTDLQRDYIIESRQASEIADQHEKAREKRIYQLRIASIVLGVIGAVAFVATAFAIPITITAQNNNATSIAQVATADVALVTATSVSKQVATSDANLATAVRIQEEAIEQAEIAETKVAIAGATLTPVPPTLTAVASAVAKSQRQLDIATRASSARESIQNGLIGKAKQVANSMIDDYPQESAAYIARASLYQEIGDMETALSDFTIAIELEPDRAGTYNSRAYVHIHNGDLQLAFDDFSKAIQLNPDYSSYYSNRANLQVTLGNINGAMNDLDQAIAIDPDNDNAYILRASLHKQLGDSQRAFDDYTSATVANPKNANAFHSRGHIYREMGDIDSALADFNTAIDLEPRYATYYNSRSSIYQELGDLDAALADFDMAIRLEPDYAIHYNNRSYLHQVMGDLDAALTDLNTAINLEPEYETAYSSRSHLNKALGNMDRAIADISEAIRLRPTYSNYYLTRAIDYLETEQYALALDDINTFIEYEPDDAGAYSIRGVIYVNLGETDHAIADYDYIIEELTEPGLLNVTAYINRGWAYYEAGDYIQALQDFERVLKVAPDQVFALANHGITLLHFEEVELALIDYQRLVEIETTQPPYPDTDIIAIAIDDLSEEIVHDPENGLMYLLRGYLYANHDEIENARADWDQAEALGVQFPDEIRDIRATLSP